MSNDKLAFGFYCETCPQLAAKLPSITSAKTNSVPQAHQDNIIQYLNNGNVYGTTGGFSINDPFTESNESIGDTCVLLTDGVWCWPESITHFIRRYNLDVPVPLVDHMRRNDWEVPSVTDNKDKLLSRPSVDQESHMIDIQNKPASEDVQLDPLADVAFWYENSHSIEDVFDASKMHRDELLKILGIHSKSIRERFLLTSSLSASTMPPKFLRSDKSRATREEIKSHRTYEFIEMTSTPDKIPLSWDEQKVVWLALHNSEWTIITESWKEAFQAVRHGNRIQN